MDANADAGSPSTALRSSSNNANRRSLSIFSRRGADTPAPATQTLAMASMSMALAEPPTPTPVKQSLAMASMSIAFATPPTPTQTAKQKRWRLSKDVRIPEGTILRMVPKDAPVAEMTPLEREMATSPNEEILRSIGKSGPETAQDSPTHTFSPTSLADTTNSPPRRYYSTKREQKNGQSDVIGVWRNGRTQWEMSGVSGSENDASGRPKAAGTTDTGSENSVEIQKTDKPKIQVVIPSNPSARRPYSYVQFLSKPGSEQAPNGTTVAQTVSHNISPPSVTSGKSMESFQVSAVSPPLGQRPIPRRPHIPIVTTMENALVVDRSLHPTRPTHSPNRSISNSSSSGSDAEDNTSQPRSSRSSMTSMGEHPEAYLTKQDGDLSRRGSSSSIASFTPGDDLEHENTPTAQPAQRSTSPIADGLRMADFIDMMRSPSMQRPQSKKRISSSRGVLKLERIDSKEELKAVDLPSPTWSEAERSLQAQLCDTPQDYRDQHQPSTRLPVPQIQLPAVEAPPPPPPRKSSKRRAKQAPAPQFQSEAFLAAVEATQRARKIRQQQIAINQAAISQSKLRRNESIRSILSLVFENEEVQPVDAKAAETVVYHMLNGVQSLQDLFNTAIINKAFYRIFKSHELDLIQRVLRTQNTAAWEYMEICRPNGDYEGDLYSTTPIGEEGYSPASYIQSYKSDAHAVSVLKALISVRCQNLLRAETSTQLSAGSPFASSSRVENALWRIWSFCRIFGCNKGREDDVIAQIDWLRGGVLAHQDSCSSTISTSDSFYLSSVLLNAPYHFAKGNCGGLNAEELYDMLEMWNCLNSIIGSVVGETEHARQFGLYDNTNVQGGDIDGEEDMLEEWTHHILTLGLSPLVELAITMATGPVTTFSLARQRGWTHWTPPAISGSLKNFLHEAVSRLYEEKICEAFSPEPLRRQEMHSIRRSRAPRSYSEVLEPRRTSTSSSIRTSVSETPASGWEHLNLPGQQRNSMRDYGSSTSITAVRRANTIARKPLRSAAAAPPPLPQRPAPSPPFSPHPSPPTRHPSSFILQPDGSWLSSLDQIAPSEPLPTYPGRPASLVQHPLQIQMLGSDTDPSVNSADKAVFRIVEMGFTSEEAKGALKITDMGDGLRVDRAVEFLLRSKGIQ